MFYGFITICHAYELLHAQTKKRKTVLGLYVPINDARACCKLALPLQPYFFDDFFLFPTDSMLHTPGICEETKIANFLIFIS